MARAEKQGTPTSGLGKGCELYDIEPSTGASGTPKGGGGSKATDGCLKKGYTWESGYPGL